MEIFNKTVENATVKVTEQGGKITIDVTDIPKYKAGDILAAQNGVFIYKISDIRGYATIDERQRLFDELAKVGKRWNAEKLCVEDVPEFKNGDFLHSDWNNENITIICRKRKKEGLCYHVSKTNRLGLCFKKEKYWSNYSDFRLATESEKQELLDALKEKGKRWNSEQLCIEDIPGSLKKGDIVIAWPVKYEEKAIIGMLRDIDDDYMTYYVGKGFYTHAIKWDGTREQYEKILNG